MPKQVSSPPITAKEVRQWFIGTKSKPIPSDADLDRISARCTQIKITVSPPWLEEWIVDMSGGVKAAAELRSWLCRMVLKFKNRGVPIPYDIARLIDAINVFELSIDLHPNARNPKFRWHAHVHTVRDLIIAAMHRAGRKEMTIGGQTGPVVRVISEALNGHLWGRPQPSRSIQLPGKSPAPQS